MARVPDINPELVDYLRKLHPPRDIRPGETAESMQRHAGYNDCINYLATVAEVQQNKMGLTDAELDAALSVDMIEGPDDSGAFVLRGRGR